MSVPSDDLPLGPTLGFMRLLWSLNHGLETTSRRMLDEIGVTAPQRMILRIVGRFPGISAGKLASELRVDPGTLSAALNRLEKRGLIQRTRSPRDARRVTIGLTAEGRAFDVPSERTVEHAVEQLLEQLDPAERETVARALQSLADRLLAAGAHDDP